MNASAMNISEEIEEAIQRQNGATLLHSYQEQGEFFDY